MKPVAADLTLLSAGLLGLAASGHCLFMCGGITTAMGVVTAKNATGRARFSLLLAYQLGRVGSYTMSGLLLAGVLGYVVEWIGVAAIAPMLRILTGLMLLLAALAVLGQVRDPGAIIGRALWPHLAPLGRRLLPVNSVLRALGFGMIWGWMPCGLAYSVLLIATLRGDALHGAGVMAAFGVGTLPALLAASFGAQRLVRWSRPRVVNYVMGGVLLMGAALTLASPWLIKSMPALHRWIPLYCGPRV